MKRVLPILVLLAAGCAAQPAALPLADKVPQGALAYVGWNGRSKVFDDSLTGQLLQEPGLVELFANIHKTVVAHLKGQPERTGLFESAWGAAGILWQHPCAAALLDVQVPSGGGGPPKVSAVLLVELGQDRDRFDGHFRALWEVVRKNKNARVVEKTSGQVTYQAMDTPVGPCSAGYVGSLFFLALGEKTPETVIALAQGHGAGLAADPAFAEAMKPVCAPAVQSACYVDVARVLKVVDAAVSLGPDAAKVRKVLRALGVEGVTALASTVSIEDGCMHERTRIYSPAPHKGLLMLLSGTPLSADALAGVPADTQLFLAASVDPAKVLDEVKKGAWAIDPKVGAMVGAGLVAAGGVLGLDIGQDLLAHMGDEWTLVSAPSLGGFLTGTVLTCRLKDAGKFTQSLAKLEDRARKAMPGGEHGPHIRVVRSGEVEIHYLFLQGMPLPVAPAWSVHGDRLYVAAWPQVVAAAATGVNEKPLAKDAGFLALRRRMPAKVSMLTYTNTPQLARTLYGLGLMAVSAAAGGLPGELGGVLRPDTFPSLPKMEKYLRPDIEAVSWDDKGITMESYGSLPGGSMGAIINVPVQLMRAAMTRSSHIMMKRLVEESDEVRSLTRPAAPRATTRSGPGREEF